jgi:glutamate dehydrogenase
MTASKPLDLVQERLLADLADTARWFQEQMPDFYHRATPAEEQARHLELLHTVRRTLRGGVPSQPMVLEDAAAGTVLVVGVPGTHHLLDCLALVGDRPVTRVELHATKDRSLFLHAFRWGPDPVPAADVAPHRAAIEKAMCGADGQCSLMVRRFLDAVDQGYLARSSVERVVRHLKAWTRLTCPEDVVVEQDRPDEPHQLRFLVATGGADPMRVIGHVGRILRRHGLTLSRGYLDWVPAVAGGGRSLIASFYVHHDGHLPKETVAKEVAHDLGAVLRPPAPHLVPHYLAGLCTLDELEILDALVACAHQIISPDVPFLDVTEAGAEAIQAHPELARDIAHLVQSRFHPTHPVTPATWERRHREVLARAHATEPRSHATVLEAMVQVAAAVRLTNAFRPGRLGLACKLDPALLPAARFPQKPFGVLFFHGPFATGFHVRFRPSARGGLRLLLPRNHGQHAKARDGLLREVYDLAWAQQLKNKDIPEGGAKCIALCHLVEAPLPKDGTARPSAGGDGSAAVRQVTDSLLDLILPAEQCPEVVGPHGTAREAALIFLGPDENMTPERIMWVANRAKARNLPHAPTLMSSKPGSGINHKEFGVTSEGIFTWLTMTLPLIGIHEDAPYTVKITGGPDGDVGGNLLKILAREHRQRCKVVAIGDGTGAAHDPAGLDWEELLRLVAAGKGIAAFHPAHLSPQGVLKPATDKAGEAFRNELHNTVPADLFVPCGGRPYTINDSTWQRFLDPAGKPNAKAMVEGANIFITPVARRSLEDAGLVVIKDSSANKGGVICSSYEVLAGLVMSDDEFLAVKPRFVADTVGLIRSAAQAEAKALLAAWRRRQKTVRLSELSAQISEEINRVSGLLEPLISQHLDDAALAETWRGHLEAHCPHILVERYRDRIQARIPRPHRVAILAKRLASRMVYREGLTWCRTYIQEANLWDVVGTYLAAERQMQAVCLHLAGLQMPGGDDLIRVIAAGAQRELVRRHLGQED